MTPLQRVKTFAAAVIAVTAQGAVTALQPPAGKIPCYADMAQDYEWETHSGKGMPGPFAGCPGAPAWTQQWYLQTSGRVQIRLRGQELLATVEDYGWQPQFDGTGACTGVKKFTTKMTHVVKNGVQYDLTIATDKPPERSTEKVVDIRQALTIPGDPHRSIVPFVSKGDPYLEIVGTETIAGQVCKKVSRRADQLPPGSSHFMLCQMDIPEQCVLSFLAEPLEMIVTAPDGTEMTHGRTTLLQFGALGQVVPADAITPP
jgi:hypothetical protein